MNLPIGFAQAPLGILGLDKLNLFFVPRVRFIAVPLLLLVFGFVLLLVDIVSFKFYANEAMISKILLRKIMRAR